METFPVQKNVLSHESTIACRPVVPHPGSMVHEQKVKGSDRSYLYAMWSSIRFMSSVRIMHDQRARECLLHAVYGWQAKGKQKSTNHTAHSTMLVGQLVVECLSSHANKY